MTRSFVAALTGSELHRPVMAAAIRQRKSSGIAMEANGTSTHRTPVATRAAVQDAGLRVCAAFIPAVGIAAHPARATIAACLVVQARSRDDAVQDRAATDAAAAAHDHSIAERLQQL